MMDSLIDPWLGWTGLLRSTLVGGATLLALRMTLRCGPAGRVAIACAGLALMLIVPHAGRTVTWPAGLHVEPSPPATDHSAPTDVPSPTIATPASAGENSEPPVTASPLSSIWGGVEHALGTLERPATVAAGPTDQAEWTARALMRWILCGLVIVGMARLVGGWIQIRRIVRRSLPCESSPVLTIAAALARDLGWNHAPPIRQSPSIDTAGVVGVRRPIVLLSTSFGPRDEQRLRAMLAHEFAHIERRDCVALALAQGLLALLFYHPLAHAIVRELRLSQEINADLLASRFAGGRRRYARALAELALAPKPRLTPVQLQPFLSHRPSFMMRIEMLRNPHSTAPRAAVAIRTAGVLAICGITLLASAIRPADLPAQENSAVPPAGQRKADLMELAANASADVAILMDVDGALKSAAGQAFLGALEPEMRQEFLSREQPGTGVTIEDLDQALVLSDAAGRGHVLIAQTLSPIVADSLESNTARIDDWTFIINANAWKEISGQAGSRSIESTFARWPAATGDPIVRVALDMQRISKAAVGHLPAMIAPVLNHTASVYADIAADDAVSATAQLVTDEPQTVVETLNALKVLARNWITENQRRMAEGPDASAAPDPFGEILAFGSDLLASAKITPQDDHVTVEAGLPEASTAAISILVPAAMASRAASQRMMGSNNLKQLALALHNYASVHGHFPAAVVRNENGVERSWRVEILPYLEQSALYEAYRKDEPWDSDANLRVLNAMPATFRNPKNSSATNETPYKALAMPGAGLAAGDENASGVEFRSFTDGMANSIILVETLPTVPWTKPVDVNSPEELMKETIHKNGILTAFADGSVHFLAESIDPAVLGALISRSGDEAVARP